MAKVWIVTIEPFDQPTNKRLIENLNSRKKIAQIEEYLGNLYKDILTRKYPGTEIDESAIKAAIIRHSGTSVALEKEPYVLRAA